MNFSYKITHSTLAGYLLWIFGFTGAHRFYYGKNITGVIWLCTGGLFMIGWIVDLFLIPRMAANANSKYKKGPYNYTFAFLLHTYSGIFGAHRFYLGKWVSGILYLVTLGFFGIGYIYDFLTLNKHVNDMNTAGKPAWWV